MYTAASGGEEDLNVTALMETQGLTCRPTTFNSNCCSVTAFASGTTEDGAVEDYHMPMAPATTSGVTEVVAMAEVSMSDFALHL